MAATLHHRDHDVLGNLKAVGVAMTTENEIEDCYILIWKEVIKRILNGPHFVTNRINCH
jgi:hypothetical protein